MKVAFLLLLGVSAVCAAGLELNQAPLLGSNLGYGGFGGFGYQQPLLTSGWASGGFQQPLLSSGLASWGFQQPLLQQQPLLATSSFGGFGLGGNWAGLSSNLNSWNLGSSFQQPLLAVQQPVVQAAAFSSTKAPTMTSTTVQNQPIVQAPIYEQRPTITNPAQGAFSSPIARADVMNAPIVRPATSVTNAAMVDRSTGAAALVAPGSLQQQPIVQAPIYEQLPTVTNAMQGTKSAPLARAAVMNAAIVRPATSVTNAAIVDSSVGAAAMVAPGSLHQQPIVQQAIYEQRPTITNPAQGAFSSPIARADVMNAPIIRPTTTLNMPAQVEQQYAAAAPLSVQTAPLLNAASTKSYGGL